MTQNNLTQQSEVNRDLQKKLEEAEQKNKALQQQLNNQKSEIDAEADVGNELKQVATIMNNIY